MIYIPMKVRHEVKALAAGRIFEFYITDDIKPDGERFNWDTYSWEAVESTTCQRYFVENTKDAQAGDTINLYINSWGGSVKEALGIYNVLRRCGATVVAYIDGVAASAASVIAMAADKVIMPRNTAMMVHNAAWGVYGNSKELRKSADDLDIINGAMLQSYIVKAGDKLPAEKLEELTDGETWLSAEMCIQYGLARRICGTGRRPDRSRQTVSGRTRSLPKPGHFHPARGHGGGDFRRSGSPRTAEAANPESK